MSTRASSAKRKAAAYQPASLSTTEGANIEAGAGRPSKKTHKVQATLPAQPSQPVEQTPIVLPNNAGTIVTTPVVLESRTLRRSKGKGAASAATTHKSTEVAPPPPKVSRKRPNSAVVQDSEAAPKRPKRTLKVDAAVGPIAVNEKPSDATAPAPPSVLAPKGSGLVPPRARRKVRVPIVDYEEALTRTTSLVPGASGVEEYSGSGGAQSVSQSIGMSGEPTSSTVEPGTNEYPDSNGEDEVSEEDGDSQAEDDDAEASESEDDLSGRAPARLEADLAAERAVWSVARPRNVGKGKGRAVLFADEESSDEDVSEFGGSVVVGESEDESEDVQMGHGTDEVSDIGVAIAGPSSKKAAPVASKNKAPTKRDLKSALERPVWKPQGASVPSTSTSAAHALQIWTPVASHATTSPPTASVTVPTAAPIVPPIVAPQQAVTGPHAPVPPPTLVAPPVATPHPFAPHAQAPPPAQPWPVVVPALAGPVYNDESDDEGVCQHILFLT
ncbi:hypothetical protein VTO73DRAFT_2202 [Trametes versicolor]